MTSEFDLESLVELLSQIYAVLFLGAKITTLGVSSIVILVGIIGAIVGALIGAVVALFGYVFKAAPVYRLSKKLGRKRALLSWIPIFGSVFRMYVLCDASGDKPLSLFNGKFTVKSKSTAFLIYLAVKFAGTALITAAISILSLIPALGQILSALGSIVYLVPVVICAFFEYACLKDLLDLFKEDKKANNTTAIAITLLDELATCGYARTIWLYTLWSKEPLPKKEESAQSADNDCTSIQ